MEDNNNNGRPEIHKKTFVAQNNVELIFLEQIEQLLQDYRDGKVDLQELLP